ncbi:MAG TPA: hypothetical protein VL123_02885 [Candidatus Udaeobacter sp.]|jgi:hypothetical protein|nr:hypothetical protein [Candidatus Udaeobacter sp.]
MKLHRLALALCVAGLLGAAIDGCSKLNGLIRPNEPPSVMLSSAPYDTTGRYFYAYKLSWIGNDPDGRVDHFIYAIDPPLDGRPIDWTATTKNEQIFFFRATTPDPQDSTHRAIAFHIFAIRAIDNGGDSSAIVTRAFFSYTVAPTVSLIDPRPSHLTVAYVTPSVRFTWQGSDIDGQLTQKPVKYKFKLFSQSGSYPLSDALNGAGGLDRLRDFFAPGFAGWDSCGGDTTSVQYTNLTPDAIYLFVVVAFDEAGAYSPIFTFDNNCLIVNVKLANAGGPKITLFNEFFQFSYLSGSYNPSDQANWIHVDVPYNQPITFNWFAESDPGAQIASYRWRLGGDVADETPRSNENTDIGHWSSPSINATSATVGPFLRDTVLFFYVEAADNNGLKSLGIVNFRVVKPTFERALGVINDTRYVIDSYRVGTTTYLPPSGNWPTAAELDTFLFARGGFPYRGNYPAGSISRPGLFKGYDFDTFSTRTGRGDLTVPLAELGKFRHLIWLCDILSAAKTGPGTNLASSQPALLFMNNRNAVNTLATYIKQGGQVWLLGSGIAHACQLNFDRGDAGTYSADGRELIPGRFMYDIVHWRNDIHDAVGPFYKFHRADRSAFPIGHPISRQSTSYPGGQVVPNYALMPDTLRPKDIALGDSLPVFRTSGFYQTSFAFTELQQENRITENMNPDPTGADDEQSTLDTLYNVAFPPQGNPPVVQEFPIATLYHGFQNASPPTSLVYTGFDGWLFSTADFVPLMKFVLENVWGLTRSGSFEATRPTLANASRRPSSGRAGIPAIRGGASSLIRGGSLRAPLRLVTPPGKKPQE